jgi:hypothetical protein
MPLVNIFVCMALICFGVCVMSTIWGWANLVRNKLGGAERAFMIAKDACWSMTGFIIVALFGLLFV